MNRLGEGFPKVLVVTIGKKGTQNRASLANTAIIITVDAPA